MKIKAMLAGRTALLAAVILSAASVARADLFVGTQGGPWGNGKVYALAGDRLIDLTGTTAMGQAVMCLEAFAGSLYVGTQNPSAGAGQVWRYDGGTAWTLVGTLDRSCRSMVVWNNDLYVGTDAMKLYRYGRTPGVWVQVVQAMGSGFAAARVSSIRGTPEIFLGDRWQDLIYRYDSQGLQLVGNFPYDCVLDFAEHNGALYAACWWGRMFVSTDGNSFSMQQLGWDHIFSAAPFRGRLYLGRGTVYWGGAQGRLEVLDGTTVATVASWPTGGFSQGVTALCADPADQRLYIGLGMKAGYYDGDGTAELWAYDGSTVARLSSVDELGGGVQCLKWLDTAPSLAWTGASARPTKILSGYGTLLRLGVEGSFVTTDDRSVYPQLPAGWTAQTISVSAGGTGDCVVAVQCPSGTSPGTYPLSFVLYGTSFSGVPVKTPTALTVSIDVVASPTSDPSMSTVEDQDAILHLRAWDLNGDTPSIAATFPAAADLTAAGVPPETVSLTLTGSSGFAYRYRFAWYGWSWEGTWGWPGSYPLISWSSGEYRDPSGAIVGDYVFDLRAFTRYSFKPPPDFLRLSSAVMSVVPYFSSPSGTYVANGRLMTTLPSDPWSAVFADIGGTPFLPGVSLAVPPSNAAAPGPGKKKNRTTAPSGILTIDLLATGIGISAALGWDMDESRSPLATVKYSWNGYTSSYTYGSMYLGRIGEPSIAVGYLRGALLSEVESMIVETFFSGDSVRARDIGAYCNATFGLTPSAWGLWYGGTAGIVTDLYEMVSTTESYLQEMVTTYEALITWK